MPTAARVFEPTQHGRTDTAKRRQTPPLKQASMGINHTQSWLPSAVSHTLCTRRRPAHSLPPCLSLTSVLSVPLKDSLPDTFHSVYAPVRQQSEHTCVSRVSTRVSRVSTRVSRVSTRVSRVSTRVSRVSTRTSSILRVTACPGRACACECICTLSPTCACLPSHNNIVHSNKTVMNESCSRDALQYPHECIYASKQATFTLSHANAKLDFFQLLFSGHGLACVCMSAALMARICTITYLHERATSYHRKAVCR
jgi:hypothetical protein